MANCQGSFSGLVCLFSGKWIFLLSRGVQSDCSEIKSPKYGLAIFKTKSWGRSSGRQKPFLGFSSINLIAPIKPAATCRVVAFWPGANFLASPMLKDVQVHQALNLWPIKNAPKISFPQVISSSKILSFGCIWYLLAFNSTKDESASWHGI